MRNKKYMDKDKKKIVLIDGHSIVFRAFYGIPTLTTSKENIQMLYWDFSISLIKF